MAHAILSWINHVDDGVVDDHAASPIPTLPVGHLQSPIIAYFWRSTSGSGMLTVDFQVNREVAVLAFAQPTDGELMAPGDTITHWLDADGGTPGDGALYASGPIASAVQPHCGVHAHLLPQPVSARYWRMAFSTGLGNVDIGRLWAGPLWRPQTNFAFGASRQWLDGAHVSVGERTFIPFATRAAKARSYTLPWQALKSSDSATAEAFVASVGISGQFFLHADPDDPRHALFARLKEPPAVVARYFDADELTFQAVEHR